jgi:trimethylamine--corrinoid protein Co-methyltransferase
MRTGAPGFGQIGISLFQAGYNQMWRYRYNLPTLVGACGPMAAKTPDAQYGFEKAIVTLNAALTGGTILNVVGGLHGELTYHPAIAVLDNDMAGMVGRFLEGIQVNEETLAIDVIEEVGPLPGFFLSHPHTREWWKKEQYVTQVFDQYTYPEWEARGRKGALEYAKEKTKEILANYQDTLPPSKHEELDGILEEAKAYYKAKGLA